MLACKVGVASKGGRGRVIISSVLQRARQCRNKIRAAMAPRRKRKQPAKEETKQETPVAAGELEPAKMTVAALREALEERGLETQGRKAELVARLQAKLEGDQGPSPRKRRRKPKPEPEEEEEEEVPEPMEDETDFSKAKRALQVSDGAAGGKKKKKKTVHVRKVDSNVPNSSIYTVAGEFDCMLNQTNIGQNNNKFYVIQLLQSGASRFCVWTRWGRVGEAGQSALKAFGSLENAEKEFCKKFKDKTRNSWEERENFVAAKGKYTLLEMDEEEGGEDEMVQKLAALDEEEVDLPVKPCSLDLHTQGIIKLIFDQDMFKSAMQSMEIDTKKMPLGKLSKAQIAKGFEALEAIEDALSTGAARSRLAELSSTFYTIIPHSFGRNVPPVIDNPEKLQKKFDMLLVLGDIELAQGLEREGEIKQQKVAGEVPHPLDINYESLKAKLTHIKKEEEEHEVVHKYIEATGPSGWRNVQLLDLFRVDREGEDERFSVHEGLENRRLLWHGTNVAVVAAILKSGLRIMPHSGGRVGRGIYLASECSKSAGYVGCAGNIGIMFLNEVALGKEKHIVKDDPSLMQAPSGYDSIVARGRTEPDPKHDHTLVFDDREVVVAQGLPVPQPKFSQSSFSQSEYLVYKESQNRIRYLLKMKMT